MLREIALHVTTAMIFVTTVRSEEVICHQYPFSDESGALLKCYLDILGKFKFHQIENEPRLHLTIECAQTGYASIQDFPLTHLHDLKQFELTSCLIQNLPDGLLRGLDKLEKFSITNPSTKPFALRPKRLQFSSSLLRGKHNLTSLDFSYNAISNIPTDFLCPVPNLQVWTLNHNQITDIGNIGCGDKNLCCTQLRRVNLESNKISTIRANTFQQMAQLVRVYLDSNQIISIDATALNPLPSLKHFQLPDNLIKALPPQLFKNNPSLRLLNVSRNQIREIPEAMFDNFRGLQQVDFGNNLISKIQLCFQNTTNLTYVHLGNNSLNTIPKQLFRDSLNITELYLFKNNFSSFDDLQIMGLNNLTALDISNNRIKSIPSSFFRNKNQLQRFNVSVNPLQHMPNMTMLTNLNELYMINTSIRNIGNLDANPHLSRLHLDHNNIVELPQSTRSFDKLKVLSLSNNQLSSINKMNETFPNLRRLQLSCNRISSLEKAVRYNSHLVFLNISDNDLHSTINIFDFTSYVNKNLQILDISFNGIPKFECNTLEQTMQLHTLYATNNNLTELTYRNFPSSIQFLYLDHNSIKFVFPHFVTTLERLKMLSLTNNELTVLSEKSFQFPTETFEHPAPQINLEENPITCSCENDWLLRLKQEYGFVKIGKTCQVIQQRMLNFHTTLELKEASSSQMFCTDPCTSLCDCYRSDNMTQVDCGGHIRNISDETKFFDQTTHLFMDGVKWGTKVPWNSIAEICNLVALFLNHSHIASLPSKFFENMTNLEELHLENNFLKIVDAETFFGLTKLRELYLDGNRIIHIDKHAFSSLPLRLLTLHRNKLQTLNFYQMSFPLRITLHHNDFNCSCSYIPQLQKLLLNSKIEVLNANETMCKNDNGLTFPMFTYDDKICYDSPRRKLFIYISISASGALLLFIFIMLFYCNKTSIAVWIYSKYGVRLFHGNNEKPGQKQYDAFICYSHDDESFVVNKLLPGLKAYRLCLHERDFLAGGYIIDSITNAIEKSCRVVLVLTPNFVKSEWCKFEFKVAHTQTLKDRCCRIMVVMVDNINPKELSAELRAYIRTNTYLPWRHRNFWAKLYYALPTPAKVPKEKRKLLRSNTQTQQI